MGMKKNIFNLEIEELSRYIDNLYSMDHMVKELKVKSIYAWVEQKVRNHLVRDYNRDYRCPICGAEKP
jgi:hypothetical protein